MGFESFFYMNPPTNQQQPTTIKKKILEYRGEFHCHSNFCKVYIPEFRGVIRYELRSHAERPLKAKLFVKRGKVEETSIATCTSSLCNQYGSEYSQLQVRDNSLARARNIV